MPTIDVQGTKFTFSILQQRLFSKGFWAKTGIAIKNEYVTYLHTGEDISREEIENWMFAMFRLLAGAYGKEYSLSFEKAGLAVDLYPPTEAGRELLRQERREKDCVMVVRLLMHRAKDKQMLGGVYSLLLHRPEIEEFANALQEEFNAAFAKFGQGEGKYLFVGVSPLGYKGCNYWYLDPTGTARAGDYVWVRMGRHNTEQIVFVDSIKYCTEDTAPYAPERVKQVLRKATKAELSE